jgi:dipeptidyl aminopeptidase/acylaminoacyl peptidase
VGTDTIRLGAFDVATGKETVVARSAKVDLGEVVIHPRRHVIEAADFPAARQAWTIVDPAVKPDFDRLRGLAKGDFSILSRDREDGTWLVEYDEDRGPVRYFAWDRKARSGTFLFSNRPKLEGLALAEMRPFTLKARDGLELNGYVTLPVGVPAKALPVVLFPHGGPWGRDEWGYDPWAQWFANRGYATLQVNFRGSTGYGKAFLNAGNREWGRKMHADLVDTVAWAVKQGWADPKRIAVVGGSYGGYSALAGATFTPDLFRCSVPLVAPSNLFTLLRSVPSYWAPFLAQLHRRVGNPDDPADEALLRAASPLFAADRIRIPILLGHGANDPRVKQAEAEQIVAAIERNGGRVTYVLYPDEGHGFARPENRTDFNARAERFLAECLGGRAEPMAGDRIAGSTAVVREVGGKR